MISGHILRSIFLFSMMIIAAGCSSGKSTSSQINITPPHTYAVMLDHHMDHYPRWSPDGSWIYFSSTRPGGAGWDIYRIPAKGGVAERIT